MTNKDELGLGDRLREQADHVRLGIACRTDVTAAAGYLADAAIEAAAAIATLIAERDSWRRVAERCKSEAEGHSMEARTANSTINKIYQVLSGGKGEPGNWNGAEPARQYVAAAEAQLKAAREVLRATTCPRPANHRPDEFTAGECFDCGECGCHVASSLSLTKEGEKP